MKPKVVILSAFLSPFRSGAEACVEEVAVRLSDRYDITIVTAKLCHSLPCHSSLGNVAVIRIGFGFMFDKWLYPLLAPLVVRKLNPDVVHAVLETFAGLALYFCKWIVPGAKRMLTLQTTNRSFLKGPIIRLPDKVTAISSVLVRMAKEAGRSDVTLISNGIDYAAITESRLRYQKIPGRILFVGRLESMKGVDTLLTAFVKMKNEKCKIKNAHLRIVGDGSEQRRLERFSDRLGISDRVTFVGHVSSFDVYKEFAQAEIFCGLSRSEALGNVFLEALGSGCAVVGTRVGGIPDIVEDGTTGILVPPDDPQAARRALELLLVDSTRRQAFSLAGIAYASMYDWTKIGEQYASLYDALVRV